MVLNITKSSSEVIPSKYTKKCINVSTGRPIPLTHPNPKFDLLTSGSMHALDNISTDFDLNSSSSFPLTAWTERQSDKQTHSVTQLNALPSTHNMATTSVDNKI